MESIFSEGLRKYILSFQKVIHNTVVSVMVDFIVNTFEDLFLFLVMCTYRYTI